MMRIPRLTIRQRLPLLISISALVILLVVGIIIYFFSLRFYQQEFKARILKRLVEADSIISKDRSHPEEMLRRLPPVGLPDEKIYYMVEPESLLLPNGQNLLTQLVDTNKLDLLALQYAHFGERDYGICHDTGTHHTLVVSAIDHYGHSQIRRLGFEIVLVIFFGVMLLALVSWFWVKRMLQPIANKINKARAIGAKSLNLRLDVKNNFDELGLLAITFNEMLERIEHGFRIQQQFIRHASHEMRTPLTAIIAEADLALLQNRPLESYQQALANVREQAEGLNELVAKLLLMARIESNNTFEKVLSGADEALLTAFRFLQVKHPKAGQSVKINIEATEAAQFMVYCYPDILQTAYFNLIDNAVKYGNGQTVQVRLFIANESVCLEVLDHGGGISEEEMEHVFKPFYRSERHYHLPGSGVGLSLVKTIAAKCGGRIHLESSPEKGTKALFSLPCADK